MGNKLRRKHNPLFHITRRQDITLKTKWIVRIAAIIFAFLLCGLITQAMGGTFSDFFVRGFDACFSNLQTGGASATKILSLLENTGILLLLAISVIPAFKMKFWNIGAEGQVVIAILICCVLQKYLSACMPIDVYPGLRTLFFFIIFICCILAGAVWSIIPAIFKAKFNTNETLFTLMMNYVALILTKVVISIWSPDKGTVDRFSDACYLPSIGGQQSVINLIIIVFTVILILIYLKFTKRGYEVNVVGGSRNTAKYIGLSVNKTILRTMFVSGAICGLCGVLLVVGEHNNLTTTIVNGRGFTGVLIAWLSGFGPIELVLYSLLAAFMIKGGRAINYNVAFPDIIMALLFFVLIGCDFFVNYQIHSEKIELFLKNKFPKIFKKPAIVTNQTEVIPENNLQNKETNKKDK